MKRAALLRGRERAALGLGGMAQQCTSTSCAAPAKNSASRSTSLWLPCVLAYACLVRMQASAP